MALGVSHESLTARAQVRSEWNAQEVDAGLPIDRPACESSGDDGGPTSMVSPPQVPIVPLRRGCPRGHGTRAL